VSSGLGIDSVASFDNLTAIGKDLLGERIGSVPEARFQICRAMAAMADC
jgi:mRNA-degrading endonuclease toxin of MazEF toxin-antitoxin module